MEFADIQRMSDQELLNRLLENQKFVDHRNEGFMASLFSHWNRAGQLTENQRPHAENLLMTAIRTRRFTEVTGLNVGASYRTSDMIEIIKQIELRNPNDEVRISIVATSVKPKSTKKVTVKVSNNTVSKKKTTTPPTKVKITRPERYKLIGKAIRTFSVIDEKYSDVLSGRMLELTFAISKALNLPKYSTYNAVTGVAYHDVPMAGKATVKPIVQTVVSELGL